MIGTEENNAMWIGLDNMKQQLVEECGELIDAVCKYNRAIGQGQPTPITVGEAYDNLLCELVDVQICIDGLCYLMKISEPELLVRRLDAVLKVADRRLESEANENV